MAGEEIKGRKWRWMGHSLRKMENNITCQALKALKLSATSYTAFKQNSTIRKISSFKEKNITVSKHDCSVFNNRHKNYAKIKGGRLIL